jgi:Family of unknown function (DUF6232)
MNTKIYYSSKDIQVTIDRLLILGQVYPIGEITDVRTSKKSILWHRLLLSTLIILVSFALPFLTWSGFNLFRLNQEAIQVISFLWAVSTVAVVATGFYKRLFGWVIFALTITGPLGEIEVIRSSDAWLISSLYRAIKAACRDRLFLSIEKGAI